MSGFFASLKTSVKGSHAFLVVIALGGLLSFTVGFWFEWYGKSPVAPYIIGAILMALAFIGWWVSHRDVDLAGGERTVVKDRYGNEVSSDVRAVHLPPMPDAKINDEGMTRTDDRNALNKQMDALSRKIADLEAERGDTLPENFKSPSVHNDALPITETKP